MYVWIRLTFLKWMNNPQVTFQVAENIQNVPRPNNHLVQAILVTICCCWPAGLAAVCLAVRVRIFFAYSSCTHIQYAIESNL